jgi:Zn-dependent protease
MHPHSTSPLVDGLAVGLAWYVVFLLSTTLHEAAHAWAALRGGDPTAYRGGQVSIDPRPHLRREPFGMLILPVLSLAISGWPFGFASAPFDPVWARAHPRRAGWMALAGPAANLALVLAAAFGVRLGLSLGWFEPPASAGLTSITVAATGGFAPAAALLLSQLFAMNLILAVLNALPVPPLDGSRAIALLLSEASAVRIQDWLSQPMLAYAGLIVVWQAFDPLFGPVYTAALNLLYPGHGYH